MEEDYCLFVGIVGNDVLKHILVYRDSINECNYIDLDLESTRIGFLGVLENLKIK